MQSISLKEIDDIRASGFRPQIVGCFVKDKKVMFVYHREYDLWQFPQGGIDNGETIEVAAAREMKEELGKQFVDGVKIFDVFGKDKIVFPEARQGSREINTDDGEAIFMKGKVYFWVALEPLFKELTMGSTEFDDFEWLDYSQAVERADNLQQGGKKRMTTAICEALHGKDLI